MNATSVKKEENLEVMHLDCENEYDEAAMQ
jgi:hypothetical protein